uniref:inositol-polyphosphate 5-phosphatase n=1 Tax=Papio anubis TaxID=9555 RepID=A0A8I5NWC1_PAPAN
MAGKAAAPGTAVLLVTANVGSLFDDVVHTHKPHFMALHCQEFGGKNYEASMSHVDKFVKELLSSDAMKEYNRARVYLDENYKSQEHFTALGSFYFLHESLKNIYQFDFKAKKYRKVAGKEIYSDTLESTPMLEKEKFPQDYFPECKWSRKGFIRTRWCIADCAFDLVNIHLFHDASNLVAWETSPSVYSGIRHKALGYVLDRIIDQRFEKVSYFVFGDFNFRLDSKSVVETLCTKATMQTVRAADTNEVVKLIFRESDNDRKVSGACDWAGDTRGLRGTLQPPSEPPCLPRAVGPGDTHKARGAQVLMDRSDFTGYAPVRKETLRLLQPGGFPRQQRHCGEFVVRCGSSPVRGHPCPQAHPLPLLTWDHPALSLPPAGLSSELVQSRPPGTHGGCVLHPRPGSVEAPCHCPVHRQHDAHSTHQLQRPPHV